MTFASTDSGFISSGRTHFLIVFVMGVWLGRSSTHNDVKQGNGDLSCIETKKLSYCDLDEGPIPVVLLSSGRSGSGSTWQILTNLTGAEVKSDEYTGRNADMTRAFFKEHRTGDWLPEILCQKQKEHPRAGAVGIKWKPWRLGFMLTPGASEALRFVRSNPRIKIIRSRRNALDVIISKHKHKQKGVEAHCTGTQEQIAACLVNHAKYGTNITLPTVELQEFLQSWVEMEDGTDRLLQELSIPHVSVSYERLYYGAIADEWKKIFTFLGKGPSDSLTDDDVRGAMKHVATSNPNHSVTLANFDEVKELLAEIEMDYLLH